MRRGLERLLDSTRTVYLASAVSLALGLFFIFVWAPHPWSWQGIDAYHELARAITRGDGFPTTDVPWGYAYFAAAFYYVFGEHVWIPLVAQVILNATVPVMLYHLVRPLSTQRTAVLAAAIVGVFSFNTVYASTQVSDTICTVMFLAALLCFARGYRTGRLGPFVLSGLLLGIVPQFRPNMVIFPALMILVYLILRPRTWRKVAHMAVFAALVASVQTPWIVRNYQLTGLFLPTSTHGGVQLWYGTLQVGPYLESRAHNPRFNFESAAFDYTSLAARPILISAEYRDCSDRSGGLADLVYWTGRDPRHRRVKPLWREGGRIGFELPPQPIPTTLYYYFEQSWPAANGEPAATFVTPFEGEANPFVSFVSDDHLGDLDRRGDLLDIFDVTRLLSHMAWGDPVQHAERLDFNHDGRLDDQDLEQAVTLLLPEAPPRLDGSRLTRFERSETAATLHLVDGSYVSVPRSFSGRQTDLDLNGTLAGALVSKRRTFTSIAYPHRRPGPGECSFAENVKLNDTFYRSEPHMMQRYMALALDNISRDPVGFAKASAYRMLRLFIIRGTDDPSTTQQFRWSQVAYGAGQLLSTVYLLVFLSGAVIAWRQRSALVLFLLPIVYVPLTICFVLTNMRYTVTVQPLMFVFVAVAGIAVLRLDSSSDERRGVGAN
ncbi:MAG: glycosyltransferase family 39 protein [Acidobacteriota bacterium]|nr:glycosyltransferase family 39 protein [Acidobacteriota bacterium]